VYSTYAQQHFTTYGGPGPLLAVGLGLGGLRRVRLGAGEQRQRQVGERVAQLLHGLVQQQLHGTVYRGGTHSVNQQKSYSLQDRLVEQTKYNIKTLRANEKRSDISQFDGTEYLVSILATTRTLYSSTQMAAVTMAVVVAMAGVILPAMPLDTCRSACIGNMVTRQFIY
jgi:hypothetical protein